MAKLTNDLLYLTHMDHSDETDEHAPVDVSGIVENTMLSMEAVFFEEGLTLSHSIEPNLMCLGNPERLARVVVILLDNALKYSSSKGHVVVNVARRNQIIEFMVANAGPGIDQEHISRIFDRFYRTDAARSRKSGSYGLGLAIAKEIIDHHKGRIFVTSGDSGLTTFFVELPLTVDEKYGYFS
ncbi:MAG: HAMP domain-containing histidine kinase [Spirochaetales bacterium]|nr:HAMP domain-containing histidine kinase [Spirochaetales bacterium]